MNNFEIVSIEKNEEELLYGILDKSTNQMVVDYKYYNIEFGEIRNYQDLSMKNIVNIFHFNLIQENYDSKELGNVIPFYSFYETISDSENKIVQFGYVKGGTLIISKNKYRNLGYFYKGYAIVDLEESENLDAYKIINIEEQIIEKDEENWIYNRSKTIEVLDELVRFNFQIQSFIDETFYGNYLLNFGYGIVEDRDGQYDTHAALNYNTKLNHDLEDKLGLYSNIYNDDFIFTSLAFNHIEQYDYNTGLCKIKDEGRFTLMNRYFMPVSDWFDDIEECQDANGNTIDYIVRKDGQNYSKIIVGNFVEEFLKAPYLFFEFEPVKAYFNKKFNVTEISNEYLGRNYCKFDKFILEADIFENFREEANIYATEDWIKEYVESEDFLNSVESWVPFHPDPELFEDVEQLNKIIKEHNRIFGIIPSSSIDELFEIPSK
jgi:hypothetical protein